MKNKTKLIIIIVAIIAIIAGGVLITTMYITKDEPIEQISDSEKFKSEYDGVKEDNIFVYKSLSDINKILESGTGVVYLGFPECPWCQKYVVYLEEVAEEVGINKIYYNDILDYRADNSKEYQKTVELLDNYLLLDDEGNKRVFVPEIVVVKNGEIIGHDNESSVVTEEDGTPNEYWTDKKVSKLKSKLTKLMNEVKTNTCTDCNE